MDKLDFFYKFNIRSSPLKKMGCLVCYCDLRSWSIVCILSFHFITSQYPPLSGPIRFILPSFLSFAICHSTPFCEITTISASSFIVIYGVAFKTDKIFYLVFTLTFTLVFSDIFSAIFSAIYNYLFQVF